MSEIRATIGYCPFCAEEDLFPSEALSPAEGGKGLAERHGGWECRSCLRVFTVKVLGLSSRRSAE